MSIQIILICTTSLIGCVWIFYNFIIPIADAITFSIGYTIFKLLHIIPSKGFRHPIRVLIYVFKSFIDGFITRTCGYGTTVESRTNKWIWKPYFHYKRISK